MYVYKQKEERVYILYMYTGIEYVYMYRSLKVIFQNWNIAIQTKFTGHCLALHYHLCLVTSDDLETNVEKAYVFLCI